MNVEQRLAARYAARSKPTANPRRRNKMTTGKWLFALLALVYVALLMHGTRQVIGCVVIVAGVLITLAIERCGKSID